MSNDKWITWIFIFMSFLLAFFFLFSTYILLWHNYADMSLSLGTGTIFTPSSFAHREALLSFTYFWHSPIIPGFLSPWEAFSNALNWVCPPCTILTLSLGVLLGHDMYVWSLSIYAKTFSGTKTMFTSLYRIYTVLPWTYQWGTQ